MIGHTGHTGEQTLELVLQLISRLDAIGLDGEIRVRIRLKGGDIEILAKSACAVEREARSTT